MKKAFYALVLLLVTVSGLVFANTQKETPEIQAPKPLTEPEMKAERERWEASPDGIAFKKWEVSPAGKKVQDDVAKVSRQINAFTNMEAVVTSLTLPPGSKLGFGLMARINGKDYILSFGLVETNELLQLKRLKVGDKLILKSHSLSYAPKYSYPIIAGDYVERDSQIIYKRVVRKGGC